MKDYEAPQIEWLRFDVYEIMTTSSSTGKDLGGDALAELGEIEEEPW
ncbi:MAG: hypothetical protein K5756_00285 [Clostridiales bacterium]|nr:hypothetical protein [Clostridiales bacterium]